MCGIIGTMGKGLAAKVKEEMIESGLLVASVRGRDSVGIGVVPNKASEAPFVSKRVGPAPMFVSTGGSADVIIGHVRSATIGDRGDQSLAHPFIFDNIIGAHNGTLEGDWRGALQEGTNEIFGSDSEAIFYNFAYWGVDEVISRISGAWALVWWDDDDKTLNMLRNSKRPLWVARGKSGNLYWASEYWMIQGMARAGERDYDKFVKEGDDQRFFHTLPVNTWRRYKFNDNGEVVQLDDVPLEGAPEPERPLAPVAAGGSDIFMRWEDGGWHQCELYAKGAIRFDPRFMKLEQQVNAKGKLYRVINGVGYVCKPGQNEITFRDLMEFHTDGACTMCGEYITDPAQIGYLPNDYSFFTCTDCVKMWIESAGERALPLEAADLDGLADSLFEDIKEADLKGEPLVVTRPSHPEDTMPYLSGEEEMVKAIEAIENGAASARAANNPDREVPSFLPKRTAPKSKPKSKAKLTLVPKEREGDDPVPYGIFTDKGRAILGHGCVTKREMDAYVKKTNPDLLVLPILGRKSKSRSEADVPPWDDNNSPLGPKMAADNDDLNDPLPVSLSDSVPPAIRTTIVEKEPVKNLLAGGNWDWWRDGNHTRH